MWYSSLYITFITFCNCLGIWKLHVQFYLFSKVFKFNIGSHEWQIEIIHHYYLHGTLLFYTEKSTLYFLITFFDSFIHYRLPLSANCLIWSGTPAVMLQLNCLFFSVRREIIFTLWCQNLWLFINTQLAILLHLKQHLICHLQITNYTIIGNSWIQCIYVDDKVKIDSQSVYKLLYM